jgi:hypothetical protein
VTFVVNEDIGEGHAKQGNDHPCATGGS